MNQDEKRLLELAKRFNILRMHSNMVTLNAKEAGDLLETFGSTIERNGFPENLYHMLK